jgi:hypothetical protein
MAASFAPFATRLQAPSYSPSSPTEAAKEPKVSVHDRQTNEDCEALERHRMGASVAGPALLAFSP